MQQIKIKPNFLKKRLESGEVKFSHTKVDGTLRKARATTNLEMIPVEYHPKTKSSASVTYFDLDKGVWRSIAEGQKITMDTDDVILPYEGHLSEEELTLMLFIHDNLDDEWMCHFIGLINSATPQRANEMGFRKLVLVCQRYRDDMEYANGLSEKWQSLIK